MRLLGPLPWLAQRARYTLTLLDFYRMFDFNDPNREM